jgi:hypothetical protein
MLIQPNDESKRQNKVRHDVNEQEKSTKSKLDAARNKARTQDAKDKSPPPNTPHPERTGNTPHPERQGNTLLENDYPSSPFPD